MFLLQTTFLHVLALGALAQPPTQSTFSSRGLCKHCTRCTECRLQSQGVHILQFHCCQWVPPTQRHRGTELPLLPCPVPRQRQMFINFIEQLIKCGKCFCPFTGRSAFWRIDAATAGRQADRQMQTTLRPQVAVAIFMHINDVPQFVAACY